MKRFSRHCILLFLLVTACALWTPKLQYMSQSSRLSADIIESPKFREQPVSVPLQEVTDGLEDPGEYLAVYWLESDFGKSPFYMAPEDTVSYRKRWERAEGWSEYLSACQSVWDDLSYFPVAASSGSRGIDVSFEDSWMYERTYRGERGHEGTDIMPSRNERGVLPVVSMTDGVIQNKGWLELGGYRIGVRSPHGAYFYYAHLDSYADLEVGDEVKAGELLGFMGDTGYSNVEGTTGKFPVHLHLGIYVFREGKEISVNPYPALKYVENCRLEYRTAQGKRK